MIALARYAREGRIGGLLKQPFLQSHNGVEGVALAYDERLVVEADRLVYRWMPAVWRGTVEHSRHVAMLLAAAGEAYEDPAAERSIGDGFSAHLVHRLLGWWRALNERGGAGERSPVVVHVDVGKTFGHEARLDLRQLRDWPYRLQFRSSRGFQLQAAAAGGRIDNLQTGPRRGTTGGFLVDPTTQRTWCMTAAHVCGDERGRARALPLPAGPPLLRRHFGALLTGAGIGRYRAEGCSPEWASWPDTVAQHQCTVSSAPTTDGLDAALHRVAPKDGLIALQVADLADISPVLELSFCGATSGRRLAAATALSIWQSYELDGSFRCIHDCLQIRLADRPYVRTDLSSGGDSGAWLLARGFGGLYWAGLLVGGDGDRSGVVPATRILSAVTSHLGSPVNAFI